MKRAIVRTSAPCRNTAALLEEANLGAAAVPEVVADAIVSAITARRPRTRYVIGGGAKMLLRLRWLLGDRAFDGVMLASA